MEDVQTVTPQVAAEMIKNGQCYVIDVRTAEEFSKHRILGAYLLPMQELQQRHGEIPLEPDKKILIYCEHGVRSARTCKALAEGGWKNLINMDGGMAHWIECGLPSASGSKKDSMTLGPGIVQNRLF